MDGAVAAAAGACTIGAMARRLALVAVLAGLTLAAACQSGAPGSAVPGRVVLVSYDGLGADLLEGWLADEALLTAAGGLGDVARNGWRARRLEIVDPTLTAPSHVSLVTGLPPGAHGIVSNGFRRPGTAIGDRTSGFGAPFEGDALWKSARRAGLRTGVLLWPGTSASSLDQLGDFGLLWPEAALAPSAIVELDAASAGGGVPLPSADGLAGLAWTLTVPLAGAEPGQVVVEVALVDGTADGRPRYDTVAVHTGDGDWRMVAERGWFELELEALGPRDLAAAEYVGWCKVLGIDRIDGGIRLLRGALNRTWAYPSGFAGRLAGAVGPWPGVPDDRFLAEWWLDLGAGIDLDTWLEQAERLDEWLDRVAALALESEQPRLLLAYHPIPDEYQHASLIVDRRQLAWSAGREIAAREGLRRVGRRVDRSVAELWRQLDPSADVLAVVSDHGLAPIFEQVRVDLLLAGAGLAEIEDGPGGPRIAATSPMRSESHGGCSHLYLNLAKREPGGVVPPAEADAVLRRAARALADLTVEGRPAVERVLTRAEAATIGLDHPHTGDLVAFFVPGVTASASLEGPVVEATTYYGQHGFLAHHDAMDGVLLARGAGIRPGRTATFDALQVAPRVRSWLGLRD